MQTSYIGRRTFCYNPIFTRPFGLRRPVKTLCLAVRLRPYVLMIVSWFPPIFDTSMKKLNLVALTGIEISQIFHPGSVQLPYFFTEHDRLTDRTELHP